MTVTRRDKYLSFIDRIKNRWENSLNYRITFSIVSAMLAVAFLFGAISVTTIYYSINQKENATLSNQLDLLSLKTEHTLNDMTSTVANLAGNTLVMNALVDTYGRDAYLLPFLKDYKIAENMPHRLTLCDFQGSLIASNIVGRKNVQDKGLLDTLVGQGKPVARIEEQVLADGKFLAIYYPVTYLATGTTEGFLVLDVALKDLGGRLFGDWWMCNLFQDNRLIWGSGGTSGISKRKHLKLGGAASGLALDLEVRGARSSAMAWFISAMLLVIVPLIWIIFRISRRISDNLTLRLDLLGSAAHDIAKSGLPGSKVLESGNDELGHLASSFNMMVDRLRESYDALESRVEERTRLLAEANRNLTDEIEQRLDAENRLKELNEYLEDRVRLEIEQHREKERMLIQQSRLASMGEMIGNIAHQWRQPLNNVGLIIQNLQMEFESETLTTESVRHEVANCMKSIQYMSSTIDDFRNFFRPDKEKHLFPVFDAVSRTATLIRPSLKNYGIRLSIINDQAEETLGYENEFCQVLMNLLNNAKDAILERKPPDPLIEIRCSRNGARALVTVRDNAGGIDESLIDRVFDPYFTTKFKTQGTGIGLYMAKTIIEKNMGGILSVRNAGDGAEFRIEV